MYDIYSKLPKINMSNTNIWFSHPLLITCFSLSISHFCKWQHNSSSWVKSKLQELSLAPILFLTLLIEYHIRVLFSPNRIYTRYRSKILFSTFIHYLKTWMFFPKTMQLFLFLSCFLVTHSPKSSHSNLLETELRSDQFPAINSQMFSNHPSPRRPLNTSPSHFPHLTYNFSDNIELWFLKLARHLPKSFLCIKRSFPKPLTIIFFS